MRVVEDAAVAAAGARLDVVRRVVAEALDPCLLIRG